MKLNRIWGPLLALVFFGTSGAIVAQGTPLVGRKPAHGKREIFSREYRDFQQRGLRDGAEGARKDIENHRSLNVNNREEFRNPPVPQYARRDYRDAFRQGYNDTMQRRMNGHTLGRQY